MITLIALVGRLSLRSACANMEAFCNDTAQGPCRLLTVEVSRSTTLNSWKTVRGLFAGDIGGGASECGYDMRYVCDVKGNGHPLRSSPS